MNEPELQRPCLYCRRVFPTHRGLIRHHLKMHDLRQRTQRVTYQGSPTSKRRLRNAGHRARKAKSNRPAQMRSVSSQTNVTMKDLHWT